MTDYLYRKFPDHIKAIQALLEKDSRFRGIADDYNEICTWLASYCNSAGKASEECDHARELIKTLEIEIIQKLEENQ